MQSTMQRQLANMLEMQDAMNTKVNKDWRNQQYPWYRAIWVESAELMDHYGWKWWKKQAIDHPQVILELVDIWHFGLSDLLQTETNHPALVERLTQQLNSQEIHSDVMPFREELERFVEVVITTQSFELKAFKSLLTAADLSFDALYLQYVGKNVLNFFRQDHGYQDGTYKKVWQGREDNEHLVEALGECDINSDAFQADLYGALSKRYESTATA